MTRTNLDRDPQVVQVSAKDIVGHIRKRYLVTEEDREEDRVGFVDIINQVYLGKPMFPRWMENLRIDDNSKAVAILTFAKDIGIPREAIIAALDE